MENERPRTQQSLERPEKDFVYSSYVEDVVIVTGNSLKKKNEPKSDETETSFT